MDNCISTSTKKLILYCIQRKSLDSVILLMRKYYKNYKGKLYPIRSNTLYTQWADRLPVYCLIKT